MKEFKYKVGDRVYYDEFGSGKVVAVKTTFSLPYCVSFEKPNRKLHNGNPPATGFKHDSDSCWWCGEVELTKLNTFKGNV